MAISIKNHEDRITALENVRYNNNLIATHEINSNHFSGSVYEYENIYVFDVSCNINLEGEIVVFFPDTLRIKLPNGFKVNGLPYNVGIVGSNGNRAMQYVYLFENKIKIFTGYPGSLQRAGYIRGIVPRLKLYYNFSYNITREFYKVKFNKLRHYLCSHLQNYASNKGGVIQNGY